MSKIKIGLLIDDLNLTEINSDLIFWINKNQDVIIDLLIINDLNKSFISKLISLYNKYSIIRVLEIILFKLLFNFEKLIYLLFFNKYKFDKINLSKLKIKKITTTPKVSKKGFNFYYSNEVVKDVKKHNLDFIIRMGSGIIKGDILNSTKYGILSFHHADNDINRGGPAGFWEVYLNQSESGFIIQKLNEVLDGGYVLKKGFFQTKPFFYLNQIYLYKKSNFYFKKLIEYIIQNNSLPISLPSKTFKGKIYKTPNLLEILKYIKNTYFFIIKKILKKIFLEKEIWYIAYQKKNFNQFDQYNMRYIQNRPNCFNADPFLYKYKNDNYLFVENYNFKKKRGNISSYILKNNEYNFLGDVLYEDFHLSFPYIFTFENKIYMCPETHQAKEIRLYECENFPLNWKYKKTLMHDVDAADTMIFKYNDIWWLFSNIDYSNINDHSSELSIFYSLDGPLTSNWKSHKSNPIIVDCKKARNAGIIFNDEKIYRVNQKPGFNLYGKEFEINLIEKLDKDDFYEKKMFNIKPDFFKKIVGTHHMSSNDEYTVIDCCKRNLFNIDMGLKSKDNQSN